MDSLKKNLWIWGQAAGSHHKSNDNEWNLPGENTMGPLEGAQYLGIPNICIVTMGNDPAPPFDNLAEKLVECPQVAWSIIGDSSSTRHSNGSTDLEAIIDLAKKYPNITGGIMDDFIQRNQVYTPEMVGEYADKLHQAGLKLWTVIYDHELIEEARPYLEKCDIITFWTWKGQRLYNLESNLNKLRELAGDGKEIMAGCYMWDYGNSCPLSMEDMKYQLEMYKKWYENGDISGIIICSNCIADIGLETADYTKQWIADL